MADKIKGITVEIGGDTTGLSAALKDINKESSSLSNELKAVEKALKLDPGNVEMLAQKEELLAKQAEVAAKRVDAIRQAQEQFDKAVASGEIEKGAAEYRKFEREVATAEGQLKKAEDAADNFGKKSVDIDKIKDAAGKVVSVVGDIVTGFAAAGAAVAGAAMAGAEKMAELTVGAAQAADDFATLSVQTGVSTDDLQAYSYAAELVDVSLDTLTGSMAKQVKSMASAADGSAKYAEAYEQLGVSVTDADGNLRDSEEVYWEVIDALSSVSNETERDALAMQLFGKSAQELNPLIAAGSETIADLKQEAIDAGAVMSEDTIGALLGVSDAMERMKSGGEAVQNNLGALGAVLMTDVYEGLGEVEGAFNAMITAAANGGEITDEMKERMTDGLTEMVGNVADALPELLDTFGEIFDAVLDAVSEALPDIAQTLTDYLPQLTQTILDMIPTIIEVGLELFVALIGALPEIIAQICDALPEIIDAVCAALVECTPQLIDAGVQLFIALVQNLPEIIKSIVKAVPQIVAALVKALTDAVPDIAEAGKNLIMGLWEGIKDMTTWIKDKIAGFASGIVDSIKDFFGIHSPSTLMEEVVGTNLALGIGEGFVSSMKSVSKEMREAIPTSFDTEVNAAYHAAYGGSTDSFDVTIPFSLGGEAITRVVSRIQYNRQNGLARVAGVRA